MSKLIAILFAIFSLLMPPTGSQPNTGLPKGAVLSETILLSINYPGAGYGTPAMCADAEVYVYKGGTLRIQVPAEYAPTADAAADMTGDMAASAAADIIPQQMDATLAILQMSPEDYAELAAFANPERVASLRVREDWDVCDGTSYHITLYAAAKPDSVPLLTKGGYMPAGDEFWEMYSGIRERLDVYGVGKMVEEWREGAVEKEW